MPRDEELFQVGTVVRIKNTGQFALITKLSYLKDNKNFLNYYGLMEGRGDGHYALYHDDLELESSPNENDVLTTDHILKQYDGLKNVLNHILDHFNKGHYATASMLRRLQQEIEDDYLSFDYNPLCPTQLIVNSRYKKVEFIINEKTGTRSVSIDPARRRRNY
jgi:hypothetical protein